ncbi:MAG: PEGA domain-containing protein [Sandaracinus sp.]
MRRTAALLVLSLFSLVPLGASAQAEGAPSVPPIMVAVLASGRVPDDLPAAVQTVIVEGVRPMAGGRRVLALAVPELRDRLAACADAACQGAFLAESGAIGAVVARLSRRGARGDVTGSLEMIDPVSGAPRLAPIAFTVADAAAAPAALAGPIEQLRAAMFTPPPPPSTLLVTVNVDGADVSIDDVSVGHSPVAATRVAPGAHRVDVARDGYAAAHRQVDVAPGEQERLDVSLEPLDPALVAATTSSAQQAEADRAASEPPWYEQWYVWVGVGAGVVVVAGVIALAVVLSQPAPQLDPMGVPLPGIRF